jgi:hypothetical protein
MMDELDQVIEFDEPMVEALEKVLNYAKANIGRKPAEAKTNGPAEGAPEYCDACDSADCEHVKAKAAESGEMPAEVPEAPPELEALEGEEEQAPPETRKPTVLGVLDRATIAAAPAKKPPFPPKKGRRY